MPIKLPSFRARRDVYPADLWTKCPTCETMVFNKQLDKAMRVCPTCGHHFRLSAATRLGPARSTPARGPSATPASSRSTASGSSTRSRTRTGSPRPRRRPGCAMRPSGGPRRWRGSRSRSASWTSGSWAGRWAPSSARRSPGPPSTRSRRAIPLIVVSASGGARMQEGTLALMQLAKTLAALERLRVGGVPFLSVLSDPDDRRRLRLVRGRRRRQRRRTERPHRVRRVARLGRDDRPGAAARLPALRVPVRARLHRPRRRAGPSCATSSSRCCACSRSAPRRSPAPPPTSTSRRPASGRSRSCRRWPRRVGERDQRRRRRADGADRPAVRRRSARRRLGAGPARAQPRPAADARVRRGDDRRLRRAPRRPPLR